MKLTASDVKNVKPPESSYLGDSYAPKRGIVYCSATSIVFLKENERSNIGFKPINKYCGATFVFNLIALIAAREDCLESFFYLQSNSKGVFTTLLLECGSDESS
jgi:hypothetical protein